MSLSIAEVLSSVRWTFENRIVPALPKNDDLAQSYANTLLFLLTQLEARQREEEKAVQEELQDLREIVESLDGRMNGKPPLSINTAPNKIAPRDEIVNLRRVVVSAIKNLPITERTGIHGYLGRQVLREARFLDIPFSEKAF